MPFYASDEIGPRELLPGTRIRPVWGEKVMMVVVDIDADAEVPPHAHPHEQAGTVLRGEMELAIADESRVLRPGDYYVIPGGVEHSAKPVGGPCQALDIFSPPREDYKEESPGLPGQE